VFCNKDLVPDYLNWANGQGFSFNILFWKKPNAIPLGKQHRPDVEYLLVFRKSAHWNDGLKGVNYSKCLEYGRESGLHPTMKPVSMIENQLLISSPRSGYIVDFFLGSGSTLIAAEKTGRKCYGMELDPKYCDVIIKRWQDFTGKKATMAGDTYEEIAAARGVKHDQAA
jgi:DNA modification methylase